MGFAKQAHGYIELRRCCCKQQHSLPSHGLCKAHTLLELRRCCLKQYHSLFPNKDLTSVAACARSFPTSSCQTYRTPLTLQEAFSLRELEKGRTEEVLTHQHETKRNEAKRSEAKPNQTKPNQNGGHFFRHLIREEFHAEGAIDDVAGRPLEARVHDAHERGTERVVVLELHHQAHVVEALIFLQPLHVLYIQKRSAHERNARSHVVIRLQVNTGKFVQ